MMTTKTALITGANKGIGYEIARQLGLKGFHIILSGRDKGKVEKAVSDLKKLDVSAQPLIMDVGDIASIRSAFQHIAPQADPANRSTPTGQPDHIDVLVNNAGILLDETIPLLNISPADFQQTFAVNAFGAFFTTQTFLP